MVEEIPQHLIDKVLEKSRHVCQAKLLHQILLMSTKIIKSSFPLIPLSYSQKVVGISKISLVKIPL